MKYYKSVEFLLNFDARPSLHKRQSPPHKCKAPVLMIFWQRFCVGAGKILGVQKIFARISLNCRKSFQATLCAHIFFPRKSWRPSFGKTSKTSWCDSAHIGRQFFKIKQRWHHFCPYFQVVCPYFQVFCEHFHRFCPNFHGVCPNFQGVCPDFRQIKPFGSALSTLAPPPPTLLLPWHYKTNFANLSLKRAYTIASSCWIMQEDFQRKTMLMHNGFPTNFLNNFVRHFLQRLYTVYTSENSTFFQSSTVQYLPYVFYPF